MINIHVQVYTSFLNQHLSNYGTLSINYWMPINYLALNCVVKEAFRTSPCKTFSVLSPVLFLSFFSIKTNIRVSWLWCGWCLGWGHVTLSQHATPSPEPRHGDCSAQKNAFGYIIIQKYEKLYYDLKCEVLNLPCLFGNWMMIGSYISLFGFKQPIVLIFSSQTKSPHVLESWSGLLFTDPILLEARQRQEEHETVCSDRL